MDAEGNIRYDALVRQGHGKDRVIFSQFKDLIPADRREDDEYAKPSEEDVQETADRTRLALEKIVAGVCSCRQPHT